MNRSYLSAIAAAAACAVASQAMAGTLINADLTTGGPLPGGTLTSTSTGIFTNGIGSSGGGYTGGIWGNGLAFNRLDTVNGIVTDAAPVSTLFAADMGLAAIPVSTTLSSDKVLVVEYGAYSNLGRTNNETYKADVALLDLSGSGVQFRTVWSGAFNNLAQNPNGIRSAIGNGKAGGESNIDNTIYGWDGNFFNGTSLSNAGSDLPNSGNNNTNSSVLGKVARTEFVVRYVGAGSGTLAGTDLNVESRALNNVSGNAGATLNWQDVAANNIGTSTVAANMAAARTSVSGFNYVVLSAYRNQTAGTLNTADVRHPDLLTTDRVNGRMGFTDIKVVEYHAGDADRSGEVDNGDFGLVFGNFGQTGKVWADGDADNDGEIGNGDFGVVFGAFGATLASPSAPTNADLVYDPTTGNVKLDAAKATGAVITNFVLKNAAGGADFNTGALLPFSNFTAKSTVLEISNTDLTTVGFSGIWNLGNVFPTGLDLTTLSALLTQDTYVGTLGSGNLGFNLVVVPEPLATCVLGMFGVSLLRRRKA